MISRILSPITDLVRVYLPVKDAKYIIALVWCHAYLKKFLQYSQVLCFDRRIEAARVRDVEKRRGLTENPEWLTKVL